MTIVVAAFHTSAIPDCPWVMVHATDRLVSLRYPDQLQPKYPVFNKTVIYRATDAIVAIGFTGIAFIEDRPTDEWMASTLAGTTFTEPLGMSFGQRYDNLNLGQAVTRLAEGLSRGLGRDGSRRPLFVIVAGARRKRRRWQRVAIRIERNADGQFEPWHFPWETRSQWNNRLIVGPTGWLPDDYLNACAEQLGACTSVGAMRTVVDEIVTEAARLQPTAIGRDVTGITLMPFPTPTVDIVYLHRGDQPSSEGFTPFMLSRRQLVAPSAVTAPLSLNLDGVRVRWTPVGLSNEPTGQEPPVTPGYAFSFRPHPDRERL